MIYLSWETLQGNRIFEPEFPVVHIKIARVKNPAALKNMAEAIEAVHRTFEAHKWSRLQLVDSKLSKSGAEHTPIAVWNLS